MEDLIFLRCEQACEVARNVKSFTLRILDIKHSDNFVPGRYIALDFPDANGSRQRRNYTIVDRPEPDMIVIAVQRTAQDGVSDRLHSDLKEGVLVAVSGVAGEITSEALVGVRDLVLLAGGIGVTLPYSLIRSLSALHEAGYSVPRTILCLSSPAVAAIPFLSDLLELDLVTDWFSVRFFITRDEVQHKTVHFQAGRVQKASLAEYGQPDAVVICGGHSFASDIKEKCGEVYDCTRYLIESFSGPSAVEQSTTAANSVRLYLENLGKEIVLQTGKSLLDGLEANDVPITSQCRTGVCGSCKIRITSGAIHRSADFALTSAERDAGFALACCSFPQGDAVSISISI